MVEVKRIGMAAVLLAWLGTMPTAAFAGGGQPAAPGLVLSGGTLVDTWMDCASVADWPIITLYESDDLDDGSKHVNIWNKKISDFGDFTITYNEHSSTAGGENDKIRSVRVTAGTWQLCEDRDLGGACQKLGAGIYDAKALGSLSGELSSLVPLSCRDGNAGVVSMAKEHLRKPNNSHSATAECLHNEEGNIANNGLVRLKWTNGKLSLVENVSHGVLWKTNTSGDNKLCFDSDAKLEITDSSGGVLWHAGAGSHPSDTKLTVAGCEATLASSSTVYWHSNTSCN